MSGREWKDLSTGYCEDLYQGKWQKEVKRTTLTFNVTKTGGDFYLIGGSTTGEAADDQADDETKDNTKDNAKGEDTQSKDNKSTGSSSDQADTDRNPTSGRMVLLQTTVPGTHQAAETVRMKIQQ